MAAKVLLPGLGGAYTSETFTGASTTGADTLDCSHMAQIAVQISMTGSATGNVDFTQSFNGSDYVAIDASLTNVAVTDGTTILLDETNGPFGVWKIDASDIVAGTNETVIVTIVGFNMLRW